MGTKSFGERLKPEQEWTTPSSGQIDEKIFNYVCDYVGLGKAKVKMSSSKDESTNLQTQWFLLGETPDRSHYVQSFGMKENNGYLYAWELVDLYVPTDSGVMSFKTYSKIDCNIYRLKHLTILFYNEPMGKGVGDKRPTDDEWIYPSSESKNYSLINQSCWSYKNLDIYK